MKINCIIVEDEPLALERTKAYVLKLPYLNLLATFDNGIDALVFLKTLAVDLIFLDINMGEFSGIQLLEGANTQAQVIFTTAYNKYAIKGFDLNITDYLLKPFMFERFVQAVDKAQANLTKTDTTTDKTFFFVKTEYRLEKILLSEILYIEGMRDYRRIHTTTKKIMTLQTFKEFEKGIPANIICRVHKSYMVAIDKIESVERDRIKLKDILIPISDSYRKSFFELINYGK
ncbi:MAG TPA: LytTR family DNA-binding domain-containing protein [Bacteroidia bacterium]|jgi:two-component system LytT family response regulator|nr:LytTR family DNA-binding domain-containing protein [Bacteroidia bacterium]